MGVIKPFITKRPKTAIKAGVKNFPTLSITLLGVKTKKRVIAKNIKDDRTELIPKLGLIAIS